MYIRKYFFAVVCVLLISTIAIPMVTNANSLNDEFNEQVVIGRLDHEHKYSFTMSECYNSGYITSHPYYNNGVYKTCDVIGYYYRDIYNCYCGAGKADNYRLIKVHSALCGYSD